MCVSHAVPVYVQAANGFRALHYEASLGGKASQRIAKALTGRKEVLINAVDHDNFTPLHICCLH